VVLGEERQGSCACGGGDVLMVSSVVEADGVGATRMFVAEVLA
jgi:hypothetical protein